MILINVPAMLAMVNDSTRNGDEWRISHSLAEIPQLSIIIRYNTKRMFQTKSNSMHKKLIICESQLIEPYNSKALWTTL